MMGRIRMLATVVYSIMSIALLRQSEHVGQEREREREMGDWMSG
jgi:hypothetical protein